MQTLETKRLIWVTGASILLGVVFNVLFFDEWLGLNFPLFMILTLATILFIAKKFVNENLNKQTIILSLLVVFFSGMVFVRSSLLLTFFNIVGSGLLLLLIINSYFGEKLREFLPLDYIKIFFLPLLFIPRFFEKISELLGLIKNNFSPKTREVVRGTLIALIALSVFTLLFSSADIIFGKIVSNIFSFKVDDMIIGRLIVFGFVTAFFLGAFGYLFRKPLSETEVLNIPTYLSLGTIETKILFISINTLFFVFIILQLTYLFGGESHILSQGITYAEYARKGFFELIAVAFLTFLIVLVTDKLVAKKEKGHHLFFKILSSILVAEVVVILVSAFARLSLYEHAYGFSTIRLYSYALIIWIGVVLVLLSHYIITNGNQAKFTLRVFSSVVLLLLSMNILNPDAFIAKRNMERYQMTGKIDESYLASLSDDALPYTISLLNDPNENVRVRFAHGLYWASDTTSPEYKNVSWKSTRLMKSKAEGLRLQYKDIIDGSKDVIIEPVDFIE